MKCEFGRWFAPFFPDQIVGEKWLRWCSFGVCIISHDETEWVWWIVENEKGTVAQGRATNANQAKRRATAAANAFYKESE